MSEFSVSPEEFCGIDTHRSKKWWKMHFPRTTIHFDPGFGASWAAKMQKMIGGCLCGQVRYTATAEPALVAVCHRKNCQKQAGTSFALVVGIPKSALSVHGNIKTFNDTGDSGQPVLRNFCPECGSPITSDVAVMPEIIFIKAGTLDDTSWLRPTMQVYCDSAEPWVQLGGEMQSFPKMPG